MHMHPLLLAANAVDGVFLAAPYKGIGILYYEVTLSTDCGYRCYSGLCWP
jgi:hypothetical protein